MTKQSAFNLLSVCSLLLLAFASEVSAQRIIGAVAPVTPGQRALRFTVDTDRFDRPELLVVTVFYAKDPALLNDLTEPLLSRGRPVLQSAQFRWQLDATFIFPHDDAKEPNRLLYLKRKLERGDRIVTYPDVENTVNNLAGSPIDVNPKVYRKDCVYYRVQLRAGSGGNVVFTSETTLFHMPDTFNVGLVGDSYGSGEGAPREGNNKWSHNDCHRSINSGLVRGVKKFIQDNPDVAVDYMHTACSGATIERLTNPQSRNYHEFEEEVPAQFDALKSKLLDDRDHDELHLLVMSVGGNDAKFGDYLLKYIVGPWNAATEDGLAGNIDGDLGNLGEAYDVLDSDIGDMFPVARVAIATYPDPTNGRYGACGRAPGPFEYHAEYRCCEVEVNPTNPPEEFLFTARRFISPLNRTIRDAAHEHDWLVVGVDTRMGRHGVCNCDDPYINTYGGSMFVQGDIWGFMHPNKKGYREVYETPVANVVNAAFNDFADRRAAEVATATTLDEESAVVPPICTPTPELIDTAEPPIGNIFSSLFINPPARVKESKPFSALLSDKDAKAALVKGDLAQLKKLPAYRAFIARRAELLPLLTATRTHRAVSTSSRTPRPLPPSVLRMRTEVQDFLKSQRHKELNERMKAANTHRVITVKDDALDGMYNRPSP